MITTSHRDFSMAAIDCEILPHGFLLHDGFLEFQGPDDVNHPQNWTISRRIWATFMLSLFNLVVTISSSIFSAAQKPVEQEFKVSHEVTVLGTTLFLTVSSFPSIISFGTASNNACRAILLDLWFLDRSLRGLDENTLYLGVLQYHLSLA